MINQVSKYIESNIDGFEVKSKNFVKDITNRIMLAVESFFSALRDLFSKWNDNKQPKEMATMSPSPVLAAARMIPYSEPDSSGLTVADLHAAPSTIEPLDIDLLLEEINKIDLPPLVILNLDNEKTTLPKRVDIVKEVVRSEPSGVENKSTMQQQYEASKAKAVVMAKEKLADAALAGKAAADQLKIKGEAATKKLTALGEAAFANLNQRLKPKENPLTRVVYAAPKKSDHTTVEAPIASKTGGSGKVTKRAPIILNATE